MANLSQGTASLVNSEKDSGDTIKSLYQLFCLENHQFEIGDLDFAEGRCYKIKCFLKCGACVESYEFNGLAE